MPIDFPETSYSECLRQCRGNDCACESVFEGKTTVPGVIKGPDTSSTAPTRDAFIKDDELKERSACVFSKGGAITRVANL